MSKRAGADERDQREAGYGKEIGESERPLLFSPKPHSCGVRLGSPGRLTNSLKQFFKLAGIVKFEAKQSLAYEWRLADLN